MPKLAAKPLFDRLLANLTKEEILAVLRLAEYTINPKYEDSTLVELKRVMKFNQAELTEYTITMISGKLQMERKNVST